MLNFNNFGLIGDFVKWFFSWLNGLDRIENLFLLVLVFVVFLVLMFGCGGSVSKKSAYKRY